MLFSLSMIDCWFFKTLVALRFSYKYVIRLILEANVQNNQKKARVKHYIDSLLPFKEKTDSTIIASMNRSRQAGLSWIEMASLCSFFLSLGSLLCLVRGPAPKTWRDKRRPNTAYLCLPHYIFPHLTQSSLHCKKQSLDNPRSKFFFVLFVFTFLVGK